MTTQRLTLPRPGTLLRLAQRWRLERRRRAIERHIDYLTQHREDVDLTLGYLYRERSRMTVSRMELERLP